MSELNGGPQRPFQPEHNVVGNSPLNPNHPSSQEYQPPKPKRHTGRNIALVVAGLFALLIVAAVLAPGQPAKSPVGVTAGAGTPTATVTSPAPKPAATTSAPAETTQPAETEPAMTAGQEQAVGAAESYLELKAFSRKGLIGQLSSEYGSGFSVADATFAVDHIVVDWNEQAARAARSYLELQHFSRSGLIEQLESSYGEGFTHRQAVYGVTKAGL